MKWIGFWKRRPKPRRKERLLSRRTLLRRGGWLGSLGVLLGGGLAGGARAATDEGSAFSDSVGDFFQKQYQEMTRDEIQEAIGRIQRKAKRRYDVDIQVGDAPPPPGVVFGFALNLSRCTGVRECVEACVQENNLSRSPQVQYIRVVELQKGSLDLHAVQPLLRYGKGPLARQDLHAHAVRAVQQPALRQGVPG